MRKNTLKQKLNDGRPTVGAFVNWPSPAMVETLGWMGMDFVIIDCEHGPMDYETTEHMIRAADLSGITPVIRIGMNMQQHIQRYMDAGAQGVLIPLVNSRDDAQRVVDSVKYPPIGKRGAFAGRSAFFGQTDQAAYFKEANDETFVALQIETPQALENQDEIINTEHADLIFLGPGDLSLNLGHAGQPAHPEVVQLITDLTKKVRDAGKHAGTISADGQAAKQWWDAGINWHVTSTNRLFIAGARGYFDDMWGNLPKA